jgi:hypothetical protein
MKERQTERVEQAEHFDQFERLNSTNTKHQQGVKQWN